MAILPSDSYRIRSERLGLVKPISVAKSNRIELQSLQLRRAFAQD